MTVGCTKEYGAEAYDEEVDDLLQEAFWSQTEVPEYKVISEETLTPDQVAEAVFGSEDSLDSEDLELRDAFLNKCNEEVQKMREEYPDGAPALLFDRVTFSYASTDQNGHNIELSAFMGWAVHVILWHTWPYDQNHVLLCCPYTHTLESECATKSNKGLGGGMEFLMMLHDNLFIMPDGQGFGADENHVQTYLNHELHAKQYYDALKVGQKIYEDRYGDLEDDWTLRIVGASQGAGDGIALHKFLDTNYKKVDLTQYYDTGMRSIADRLCEKYDYPKGSKFIDVPLCDPHRLEYSYVCCGPYSPEVTMQTYSEWGQMSYPCVIPLVIKSMLACYPDFLCKEKGYKEEDFFSQKWNDNKADFDEIYLKKTKDSDELNEYICEKLGISVKDNVPMVPLSCILSEDMTDPDSQIYKDLMTCLKKQELTSGWTPRTKIKLLFTQNDEVVPYENTKKLIELFDANKCTCKKLEHSWTDEGHSLKVGHVECCARYITSEWDW